MTWNPGFVARDTARDGTERHTLPDAPAALHPSPAVAEIERPAASSGLFDAFFSEGDEGRYQGGPATIAPVEIELDEPPEPVVLRTPEMDARRAIFARGVAVALGCLVALLAVGVARQKLHAPRSPEPSAAAAQIAPARPTPNAPAVRDTPREFEAAAPASAPVLPEPKAAEPVKLETPAPAPKPVAQSAKPAPVVSAPAPKPAPVAFAPAAKPVTPVPASTLPSVGSFAAKTPIPASVRASVPTASFAVK